MSALNFTSQLPYSPDAEQATIACLLHDPTLAGKYDAEAFHHPCHRTLYVELCGMAKDGRPLEPKSVSNHLLETGLMDKIGGPSYLSELYDATSTPLNNTYYGAILVDKHRARQAALIASNLAESIKNGGNLAPELLAETLEKLAALPMAGQDKLSAALDSRLISMTNPPSKPIPIYTMGGQSLCTEGNLTTFTAPSKAGKTAALNALLASALTDDFPIESFTFQADPHRPGAVVYIDTEQSSYDAYAVIQRALHRAGLRAAPDRLRCYSLADVRTADRRAMLNHEIERAAKQWGSIHSVFIDGIGDLCGNTNDLEESEGLVGELHALAIKHKTCFISVLHENPGDMREGKAGRGHLGTALERKSESNLRLAKEADGSTVIYTGRCRHMGDIPKAHGIRFRYDAGQGMHVQCEAADVEKSRKDLEGLKAVAAEAFGEQAVLKYSELCQQVKTIRKTAIRAAERYVSTLEDSGVIKKNPFGQYRISA